MPVALLSSPPPRTTRIAGPPDLQVWKNGDRQQPRRRLTDKFVAASSIVALVVLLALLGQAWAVRLERRSAARMAPELIRQRDMGVALERADFSRGDILPLYGSSELQKRMPYRSADFFRDAPGGFRVCPVGQAGTTSLLMLERAAAAGVTPACGKAVVLVSQFWFLSGDSARGAYAGNFSVLQGMELIFKAPLSRELRRDIARRMLDFPSTVRRLPLLEEGTRAAADSDTASGRTSYALLLPMGRLETRVLEMQDHFDAMGEVLAPRPVPPREPAPPPANLEWDRLIADADSVSLPPREVEPRGSHPEDPQSVRNKVDGMAACPEWRDLELLLRTFRELHIQIVLLDIPWCASYYENKGVTADMRGRYYAMLQALADKYGTPVATFRDHESDSNFLHDHRSHLNPKGWAYFDCDIDAFWHGKPLPER